MQLTLTNEKLSDAQLIPITIEIQFEIWENGSLYWDGKAYPNVNSGCNFGGVRTYKGKETIREIIDDEKEWLKKSYGRPIKEKITIVGGKKNENSIL